MLARQAGSWHGHLGGRRFPVASRLLGGDEDKRCVLATATQDGTPRALLHFVPWGTQNYLRAPPALLPQAPVPSLPATLAFSPRVPGRYVGHRPLPCGRFS